MKNKLYRNKELGVYKVGSYKIGDEVELEGGDYLKITEFSEDGEVVYGEFFSDDCGGEVKFSEIIGFRED